MRIVNIGFNVETSKAVKGLKGFEDKLISIEAIIDKINKTGIEPLTPSDNGAKFGQSIKPLLKTIGNTNEEIKRMKSYLNEATNLDTKSITNFTGMLDKLNGKSKELENILGNKELLKGLNPKEISKILVDMKDLTSETNKIKSAIRGFTDGTVESIKKLESMSRQVNLIEDSVKNIKKSAILDGKINIESNADTVLKEVEQIRNSLKSAYSTGDYKSIDLLNNSISELINKNKILKKEFGKLPKVENVNMNSSISQLDVLLAQLKRLASTDPSVRLKGGLKDVSEETVKLIADAEKLRQAMASVDDKSDIPDLKAQLIDVRQEFNKLNNAKVEINPSINKNALVDMISLTTIFYTLKSQLSVFMELEDATYDLGVVAQKSDAQIQTMRQTMIDMGQDVPVKIVEITKAMNETMRTGKSYSEAMNLVSEASKLAVASNEDLANSMLIVNKIFTALKINANDEMDVKKAMQNLHATATFTATDLAGLGESAKQWVGAVGVLSETTNKTGEELDDYRLKLMETGNAFSGILSNMGRASEQSGEQTLCPFVTRVA